VAIQAVFDTAGNPLLVANFIPDGSLATATWTICPPGTNTICRSADSNRGVLQPGPAVAGTRFVATAVYGGISYASAVTWRGQVHALSRPMLRGKRQLNGVVIPVAARWSGGWGNEFDQLGVEACRSARGRTCRMLGGGELGCPDKTSRTRLGGWFTGWFLFALDDRSPRDEACAGTGYTTNADLPIWKLGPTIVRSGPLGTIAGPPRPQVTFLTHTLVREDTLLVASVNCRTRCTVKLSITDAKSGTGISGELTARGRTDVGLKPGPIQPGELLVSMHIDDSPDLQGRSLFR
jgi:hypothetical protein